MQVRVNGEAREVAPCSVAELLAELDASAEGVAVAVNGTVVPRSERAGLPLREGDRVEIIRAVGGG
ncbi:MAG: sulfur carrier protein ThiS [Pseudomonadota bacterium]|jgi:sulfur carrier protein